MRITVIALDTRGGVQPYAALALRLAADGHQVQVATFTNFVPWLASLGLPVLRMPGDAEAAVRRSGGVSDLSGREHYRLMRRGTSELIDATVTELLRGCPSQDLLTGGIGGELVGRPVAERLDIPFVSAHLQPLGPATTAYPGILVQLPSWLGAPGRLLSHHSTNWGLRRAFRDAAQRARVLLDLPTRAPRPDPALPVLYGYSSRVVPRPREWTAERHVVGYWPLPAPADWKPPPDLETFLDSGPPPVTIGFGSMNSAEPERLTELISDAVGQAGVRAVVLTGWGGLSGPSSSNVFVTNEVPHDWLYPRSLGVVHHGGAGTTGAALLAGRPAVVVPFAVDQPFWASRVVALGAGPPPIPRRRLTAPLLAQALRQLAHDKALQDRASEMGHALRSERGLDEAARLYAGLAPRTIR